MEFTYSLSSKNTYKLFKAPFLWILRFGFRSVFYHARWPLKTDWMLSRVLSPQPSRTQSLERSWILNDRPPKRHFYLWPPVQRGQFELLGEVTGPPLPKGRRRDAGPFSAKLKKGDWSRARSTWGFRRPCFSCREWHANPHFGGGGLGQKLQQEVT